jgi:hypothetical protein
MNRISGLLFVLSAFAVRPVSATILQADFGESLDSPTYDSVSPGPYVVSRTGVTVPATVVFGPSDLIQNPKGWLGTLNLSFDPTTDILSVVGAADQYLTDDYQIITISLSNLVFDDGKVVTGITPLVTGNALIPDPDNSVTQQISTGFTSNSASITYEVANLTKLFYISQDGTDQFQLTLGTPVTRPEPGTVLLAGLALAAVATLRRLF